MIALGGVTLYLDDPLTLAGLAAAGIALLVLLLLVVALRGQARQARLIEPLLSQMGRIDRRVDEMGQTQLRLSGGLSAVGEAQTRAHSAMMLTLEQRLEDVTRSMGETLQGSATRTARSLG